MSIKSNFLIGDTVYFVSNSIFLRKATIIRSGGGFYTIKFDDTGGGTRVRESKLFKTEEDAMREIKKHKQQ